MKSKSHKSIKRKNKNTEIISSNSVCSALIVLLVESYKAEIAAQHSFPMVIHHLAIARHHIKNALLELE